MLTPELQKLKKHLEGHNNIILNNEQLLEELEKLDKGDLQAFLESLAISKGSCSACGRPF
jgi:hypothetical protein